MSITPFTLQLEKRESSQRLLAVHLQVVIQLWKLIIIIMRWIIQTLRSYPRRGVKSAWKMVQAGEGYIASGQNLERAVIRSVRTSLF